MLKTILIYRVSELKKMSWSSNDNNSPWGKKPKDNKSSSDNSEMSTVTIILRVFKISSKKCFQRITQLV